MSEEITKQTRERKVFGRIEKEISGQMFVFEMTPIGVSFWPKRKRVAPKVVSFDQMIDFKRSRFTHQIGKEWYDFEIHESGVKMVCIPDPTLKPEVVVSKLVNHIHDDVLNQLPLI